MPTKLSNFALWLCPGAQYEKDLAERIGMLSARFSVPAFDPHLTVFAGSGVSLVELDQLLEEISQQHTPLTLEATEIAQSENFFKTLYIQFSPQQDLSKLFERADKVLSSYGPYVLNPHLSLLYAKLDVSQRRALVTELGQTRQHIEFDRIKVVVPGDAVRGWEAIEMWRVLRELKLEG